LFFGQISVVAATIGLLYYFLRPDDPAIPFVVFAIAYVVFFTVMFVFFSTVVRYQDRFSTPVVYAVALIADSIGIAVGNLLHPFVSQIASGQMSLLLFAVASFFIVASVFFFNKHSLFPVDDRFSRVELDEKELYVRCIQLSVEKGLTPRQEEIFILLVRGKRVNVIAESLTVSPRTVRTHVHQIYEKLDAHSHQEMMALVTGVRTVA
jgi:DNA-binding CsgD family transcriptional regulator